MKNVKDLIVANSIVSRISFCLFKDLHSITTNSPVLETKDAYVIMEYCKISDSSGKYGGAFFIDSSTFNMNFLCTENMTASIKENDCSGCVAILISSRVLIFQVCLFKCADTLSRGCDSPLLMQGTEFGASCINTSYCKNEEGCCCIGSVLGSSGIFNFSYVYQCSDAALSENQIICKNINFLNNTLEMFGWSAKLFDHCYFKGNSINETDYGTVVYQDCWGDYPKSSDSDIKSDEIAMKLINKARCNQMGMIFFTDYYRCRYIFIPAVLLAIPIKF